MTQIIMCGDPFNISGYSSAMRDHIRALVSAGVDVRLDQRLVNADRIELDPWWKDHLDDMMKPADDVRIAIHYMIAEHFKPQIEHYNIGFTYWEISRINKEWIEQMSKMDEMWSASQFALDVFKECGVDCPTTVAPWPLNERWFGYDEVRTITPDQEGRFTFFSMGELTERKNFADLVAAYCIEFQDEALGTDGSGPADGTSLVIKTYHGLHNDQNNQHVVKTISNYRDRLQIKRRPGITLMNKVLPQPELAAFMNSTDCFVYPTKGEGMGGPAIQMMALGKPIIAPYHTSIQDYHVSPWRVDFSAEPVHSMNHIPAYQGTNAEWYRPDITSLRRCMREAYEMWKENRDELVALGIQGREFIRNELSYERVGSIMRARLEKI